jgi:4-amino-4-deoxy-L-arabinose transferase-like glycosyltransferase
MAVLAPESAVVTAAVSISGKEPSAPTSHLRRAATPASPGLLWPVGILVVALVLRLYEIRRSYDIFIDEVSYTRVALNLAHGSGLTLYGKPFDLHPPTAFSLFAGVILLFGLHGGLVAVLMDLRVVTATCGALIAVAVYFLADAASKRRTAALAALLVAIDPFAILYDSRVMLEAPAQLATVSTMAFLAAACRAQETRATRRLLAAAGLCAALAVTTKETFGLVVVATLLVLVVTGWVVSRRQSLAVLAMAAIGYAIAITSTALSTGFGYWWQAKVSDFLRLVGTSQQTGFNAPSTHVSLLSRVFADGPEFAMTYVVLFCGSIMGALLLWRYRPWAHVRAHSRKAPSELGPRERAIILIAVWTLCAGGYLAYATLFGSIEEQMYYILLTPTIVSFVLWLARTLGRARRSARSVASLFLAVVLAYNAIVWGVVHTRSDSEYLTFLHWEASHIPPGQVISVTENIAQFIVQNAVLGQWHTLAQLRQHHVDYVLVSTDLVEERYGLAGQNFASMLERNAKLVFEVKGPSDGSLQLYNVKALTEGPNS